MVRENFRIGSATLWISSRAKVALAIRRHTLYVIPETLLSRTQLP